MSCAKRIVTGAAGAAVSGAETITDVAASAAGVGWKVTKGVAKGAWNIATFLVRR